MDKYNTESTIIVMKHLLVIIFSFACIFSAFSKENKSNTFELNYSIESFGRNPDISPAEVKSRLEALPTRIEMTYSDEVYSYIEKYMKHGRKQLISLLVRSRYYLPIFEKALKDAGLPEELKYLPVIESGLNAKATSHAGAAGLWQFMAVTAKGYDMQVSSSIDERRDPYLSSERACRMLADLYEKFGDWHLALAAYNAGPGRVQKAIKRSGVDPSKCTFRSVSKYLPAETQKYVPLFIAMNYVMNYYQQHNIPEITPEQTFTTDTIRISEKISFKNIASTVDISIEDLRTLNPHFKSDVIPASKSRSCTLILPSHLAREYKIRNGLPVYEMEDPKEGNVMALNSNNSENKKDKLRNWNDDEFMDVPSQSMPGTYVRVARKSSSSNPRRRTLNKN